LSKKINTDPINFVRIVEFIHRFVFKSTVIALLFVLFLFLFFYRFTDKIFSNDYVLNTMLKTNIYSRQCLYLHEDDPELITKLNDFYGSVENKNLVLPVFFNNMPIGLASIKDIQLKKNTYINILLPILLKVQKSVLNERARLIEINSRMINEPLMAEDFAFIDALAEKYNVKLKNDDFWTYVDAVDELLLRVDVIPASIALGISAKETGWGSSRFLQEGNSLFSQWTFDESAGIIPLGREAHQKHVVKKFDTLEDAVRSFYTNINTHNGYKEFREQRRRMRLSDGTLNAKRLIPTFFRYSTEKDYTEMLRAIIVNNSLERFDNYTTFSTKYRNICLTVL
jgi:Bax protein